MPVLNTKIVAMNTRLSSPVNVVTFNQYDLTRLYGLKWTRPSFGTPMSTNAPKAVRFVTVLEIKTAM